MRFQSPLVRARLLRRYKRFLADFVLDDGREITAHCPNPGAMTGLADAGQPCWLQQASPGRKLGFGWRLVELPGGHLANVDTSLPNRVVAEALAAGALPGLEAYRTIRPEIRYGTASRVDFLLQQEGLPDALLEVKSVTLDRAGVGAFPDSVTLRGARHLRDLAEEVRSGRRAVMLFLLGRTDCHSVTVARDIDPAYAQAFDDARAAGVEMRALASRITTEAITHGREIPVLA
ncbi:DNA/RNA nuclease SfsA [Halodurantibacterium flavum]|uniref:Sugar fermentation stimulation protein homolog n=1 Tax=Halodurantibacterium flavum TaxID=1382802 RepID=A0ABW4S8Y2_9RHOB